MKHEKVSPVSPEDLPATPATGLTEAEAARRAEMGLDNRHKVDAGKSVGQILAGNFFSLFNMLNFALAACLILVGSYRNMLFLGVGASAACFATWGIAVKLLGAVKTSAYIYLVPVITVAASVLVLGEPLTPQICVGVVLTCAGLVLSERGKGAPPAEAAACGDGRAGAEAAGGAGVPGCEEAAPDRR